LLLLVFLGYFYIRTTPLPSVVDSFNPRYYICPCLADYIYNVDKVYRTLLVKARMRLIAHFSYKRR
jgi:hypothetical protein